MPLMAFPAVCGFPSPADDYLDRPLDFNELLIQHPAATFAVRIVGDIMTGIGLFPGDIAVVDRSLTATDRSIVLALLDGEFTIKLIRCTGLSVTESLAGRHIEGQGDARDSGAIAGQARFTPKAEF